MHSRAALYLLLTDTGTLFTRTIKYFTDAPYNHVSIALDPELNNLYSFGRKRPTNPLFAGFVKECVYGGTFRHFPQTRCTLLKLYVTPAQRAAAVACIRKFQAERDRYRYNLLGLIGVLLNREVAPENAFFCSQFAAYILEQAGCRLWDKSPALVTPEDFRTHPAFETVYTGLLYDYPPLTAASFGRMAGAPVV